MQQFGAGATKTADFFGQVAANDSFNNFQDGVTKILHGDPSKMVQGPDGPMPDTGYLGLKGRAALDARPGVSAAIDNLFKTTRNNLATPDQQLQFDTYSRRYRAGAETDIGSHADQQSTVWYGTVNDATANNALTQVAINANDPVKLVSAAADYIGAKVKNAQLAGAQPNDPVWTNTVNQAKQDVLTAQVQSIGATDPVTAMRILDKNRDIAGTAYDNLYASLKDRAYQQQADTQATGIIQKYSANGPVVRPPATAAGMPTWIDTYYDNIAQSESTGRANAQNPTSTAFGYFQILDGTARWIEQTHPELGLTGNWRADPVQSRKGYAAFTMDNAKVLAANRVPITPGNLYLAAFFGAQGAASFYDLPANTPMIDAVPSKVYGPNAKQFEGKTVGDVRAWAANAAGRGIDAGAGGVGGAPASPMIAPQTVDVGHPDDVNALTPTVPEAPSATAAAPTPGAPAAPDATPVPFGTQSVKAHMLQEVLDSDEPPEVKQRAASIISQQLAIQQAAADQTAAAKKALSDQKAGGYMTKMLNGDTAGMLQQIANDPDLEWNTKSTLSSALMAHADSSASAANATYGDGYYDVMRRILAKPDDPTRIASANDVLQMAIPGPNGEAPKLTLAGASKLTTMMTQVQKDPDQTSINDTKSSLMTYAKTKLTNSHDPFFPGDKSGIDPTGERIFNGRFIPKFEAAYAQWVRDGKDPWQFLTQDNVDKLSQGLRSPGEMAMAKLQAMQTGVDVSEIQVPPPPAGVDGDGWKLVVTSAPVAPNGTQWPIPNWTATVNKLVSNPTPDAMAQWNTKFGADGALAAQNVLDVLGVKPVDGKPAPAPVAPAQSDYTEGLPLPAGAHVN